MQYLVIYDYSHLGTQIEVKHDLESAEKRYAELLTEKECDHIYLYQTEQLKSCIKPYVELDEVK